MDMITEQPGVKSEAGVEDWLSILRSMRVKIFADGADMQGMLDMYSKDYIKGFTTNPTLMRKAGINDYERFAHEILRVIVDRPISFEVFSDDFEEMHAQALAIQSWGSNVYVKIPVTNSEGKASYDLINSLSHAGVKLNVTAILTLDQVRHVSSALLGGSPSCVSVFAGRLADLGKDPLPLMTASLELLSDNPHSELIWASPRELLNIFQADAIGCHIITVTNDILKKLQGIAKSAAQFSLETVQMFRDDAVKAGYSIRV